MRTTRSQSPVHLVAVLQPEVRLLAAVGGRASLVNGNRMIQQHSRHEASVSRQFVGVCIILTRRVRLGGICRLSLFRVARNQVPETQPLHPT